MARKTNKSVSKRIKVSASGKMLYRKPGFGHFRRNKSTKQKRAARTKDFPISNGFRLRLIQTLVS
ncbi:MAG: 50S ribosomal protein L35 [Verrucomicrobia bacterium]|nr:MAG: 50S ribosomal protein L35 [Verrucomicrobiota bacterium]